ncbi:MAG: hypothetical protein ABJE66_24435 [Deltaproteobacteria bacterium]
MLKKWAALLALVVATQSAGAWEAQTTQAGLAEQAALASRLHHRLTTLGFTGGLFEELTIPPADAHALIDDLHLLSPTHGSVPDARGRQTALAWLAAGAALADVPAAHGADHFYDPLTKRGWQRPSRGIAGALAGIELPERGVPAPDWVIDNQNPFNLAGFLDQYAKAVTAATPGERSRAMAGALIAAGAMLHVLGDLGAPSRVRSDYAVHLEPLGGGAADVGSRMERIAALAYGRLGVPLPGRTITRAHMRDYFTSPDGGGLADVIARSYFSPNTLPESTRVNDAPPKLVRAKPALPAKLNLMAAGREGGTTLRNADGTCLARYRIDHSVITWSLDDDCMLEQLAVILPEVAAYETGLLDFLLRGELAVAIDQGQVAVSAKGLGAGTLDILVEDDRGVRTSIGKAALPGGPAQDQLAKVAMPTYGTRVVAVFSGADQAGEPIVAVGALPLTH